MTRVSQDDSAPKGNFIRDIVDRDLASGKHTTVVTRFPPEPNGYLHIGHAKSILLNFGLARDYGGRCHLRFDDTNPETEDMEYVESIMKDARWLGVDWGDHLYFASDYYQKLYDHAVHLIRTGKAYVDSINEEQMRALRGTVTEPGRPSPYRDRSIEDNLELFERMRKGDFREGEHVLRAKIDLASPNMKMRDPAIYRIKHASHYRTGNAWCVYPLYDFTHCLSDSFEGITHSICTLEFENNRELYDWVLDHAPVAHVHPAGHPQQIEFARLNLSYTLMSKRKLLQLVDEGHVSGWDDPRMPTIAGMRRRGYTPAAIQAFCEMIGVAKANSIVDLGKLEFCIRDDLNRTAPRLMGVLRPLKVVIDNYPENDSEIFEAPCFPPDVGGEGMRSVPFSREIYIERDDFMKDPPPKFFRLSPGGEVRLRYGYLITCNDVVEKGGEVVELRCSVEKADRRVKGTIHWVSAAHAIDAEVRLYDRLFQVEEPESLDDLNPDSLVVLRGCKLEPAAAAAKPGDRYQLERQGYFCVDLTSTPDALVLNRTVTLRDTWAKLVARKEPSVPPDRRPTEPIPASVPHTKRITRRDAGLTLKERERAARYLAIGLEDVVAFQLAQREELADLFEAALDAARPFDPKSIANLTIHDVARELKQRGSLPFGGREIAELAELVEDGTLSSGLAKEVLTEMAASGGSPRDIVSARGLQRLAKPDEIEPIVEAVLAENAEPVARYRAGKTGLFGFFVGQVMKRTGGKADAALVQKLLAQKLSA